jgi:hypothetical protein
MPTIIVRALAWGMPWLASLALAALMTYAVTTARAAPSVIANEPVTTFASRSCAASNDRVLAYAVSTKRVPADLVVSLCESDVSVK